MKTYFTMHTSLTVYCIINIKYKLYYTYVIIYIYIYEHYIKHNFSFFFLNNNNNSTILINCLNAHPKAEEKNIS